MGLNIFIIIMLAGLSALFSVVRLGLFSLSMHELKRKIELGDINAAAVYPLRRTGNQVIISLLIATVIINSTIAVFLGDLTTSLFAVLLSAVIIILLSEIFPRVITRHHTLILGAKFVPVVDKLILILSPITKPLGSLLDGVLGASLPPIFTKDELIKIIKDHSQADDSNISNDEMRIAEHALNFSDKQIKDVMTPRKVVRFVKLNDSLSPALLDDLHKTGFSRFPVQGKAPDEIVGTLFLHDLVNTKDKTKVKDALDKKVYFVNETETLHHALDAFFKTKYHMYVVINEFSEVVGVITIEDVIEEILGKQIVDEFDQYEDMRTVARRSLHN